MVKGWAKKSLDELFNFYGGVSASREQLSDIGIPYLHYGDIHGTTKTYVDATDSSIPRFNTTLGKVSDASLLRDGDVVFVDASEDYEGASKHVVVRNDRSIPFISGLHTLIARPKTDELDNNYKEFCFQTADIKNQFRFYAVGTKVLGVNKNTIGKIVLHFPVDTKEQATIAEALSDADAYIAVLEKLIAKKKAVKVGAIQELLTGKRRLKGFTDKWIEKRVDFYGNFISGSGFPLMYQGENSGDYPFYKVSDFNNKGNEFELKGANHYISKNIASVLNCKVVPRDSIIFAKIGAAIFLERKRQNIKACCIDNNMMAFAVNAEGDSKFLTYIFQTICFGDLVSATALPSLGSKQIGEVLRGFPPTKAEQSAIAEVLSDMDIEIEALTAQLDKDKAVKVGMMQQLLTGQIRLVSAETQAVATPKPSHSKEFEDAVIISAIVNGFYNPQFPLGRVKITKLRYLLDRRRSMDVSGYKEKAAGPYDPTVRYSGGESIAQKNGYITISQTNKGATFGKGAKIAGIQTYIDNWGLRADIDWLVNGFKYFGRDDLEVLATVDNARLKLEEAGQDVTVKNIVDYILQSPEWQAKRDREEFADDVIAVALKQSKELFS